MFTLPKSILDQKLIIESPRDNRKHHLSFAERKRRPLPQSPQTHCFIPGLGMDYSCYLDVFLDNQLHKKGDVVAFTLPGFEPPQLENIPLINSIKEQAQIIGDSIKTNHFESPCTYVPFSLGADVLMEAIISGIIPIRSGDKFFFIEPNICLDTCTITKYVAESSPQELLLKLVTASQSGDSNQVFDIANYFARLREKDWSQLQTISEDILKTAEERFERFCQWIKTNQSSNQNITIYLADDNMLIKGQRMLAGTNVRVEGCASHFTLLEWQKIKAHLFPYLPENGKEC